MAADSGDASRDQRCHGSRRVRHDGYRVEDAERGIELVREKGRGGERRRWKRERKR